MPGFREAYYDVFSSWYDRFIALHRTGADGVLKAWLAAQAVPGRDGADGLRILDLCTGTGASLPFMARRLSLGDMLVGVDFSAGMLSRAMAKVGKRTYLVRALAGRLPFACRSFDVVTCAHAFYELRGRDQDRCLREIRRVLKPGGRFLMLEHDAPEHPVVRCLFLLRLLSMGTRRAADILRREDTLLARHFVSVHRRNSPSGHSKLFVCDTSPFPDSHDAR